jgi:adenosylhomocysteine nucleosidase
MPNASNNALPDHLVIVALPQESRGLLEAAGAPVVYCGVGKVNAAMALTRRLADYRAARAPTPFVLNLGSAGSRSLATRSLVACNRFEQRDMDVTALGFAPGETPYDTSPRVLETAVHFAELPNVLCSTADSFATHLHAVAGDVVDMEAYALARVCRAEQARFACVKYVTDGADGAAANDWRDALDAAATALAACYRRFAERLRDE